MALIRHFTIEQLRQFEATYVPIVDKILYKGDTALFKARSKTGKSTIVQQLSQAISSGQSFLNVFPVPAPLPVCYISGEGYIGNWKERFKNMSKMWKINEDNFAFLECTFIQLHREEHGVRLLEHIQSIGLPFKVFVFDPLMCLCTGGSYNNEQHIGTFLGNVELIKRTFDGTAIVVHHDSEKDFVTSGGKKVKVASPTTSMGTSSINAIITHSYTLEKYNVGKKVYHRLILANERASWMIKQLDLEMIVPETDPEGRLGYVLKSIDGPSRYNNVMNYIMNNRKVAYNSFTEENLGIEIPTSTLYKYLEKLMDSKMITKVTEDKKDYYVWCGNTTQCQNIDNENDDVVQ